MIKKTYKFIKKHALFFAWLISMVAAFGSLYASEILRLKPCPFCWYQRVFLFPLVFILGAAAYKNDKKIVPYILNLPAFGAIVALVQSLAGYFKVFSVFCTGECVKSNAQLFDLVDFSVLSLIAFVMIFFLLLLGGKR